MDKYTDRLLTIGITVSETKLGFRRWMHKDLRLMNLWVQLEIGRRKREGGTKKVNGMMRKYAASTWSGFVCMICSSILRVISPATSVCMLSTKRGSTEFPQLVSDVSHSCTGCGCGV